MMKVAITVPCIELILAIVATIVPLSAAEFESKIPMLIILLVLLGIGEIFRIVSAKGRKMKVYKLPMPVNPLFMDQVSCDTIDADENAEPRVADEPLIASYMNYLVTNHGVIVPQYGDENDALAVETLQKIYDEVWGEGVYRCVGVQSEQVVYGGGNITASRSRSLPPNHAFPRSGSTPFNTRFPSSSPEGRPEPSPSRAAASLAGASGLVCGRPHFA